jgi:hypothetical protein
MKSIIIITIAIIVSSIVLGIIFGQGFSDSEGLQNAIDACTNDIDNGGSSGRNLENCLDGTYNQYGNTEEKQEWFGDDEH